MAELLCPWDSDWILVKFGLLRFISHFWIRISQIIIRTHSEFSAITSLGFAVY